MKAPEGAVEKQTDYMVKLFRRKSRVKGVEATLRDYGCRADFVTAFGRELPSTAQNVIILRGFCEWLHKEKGIDFGSRHSP